MSLKFAKTVRVIPVVDGATTAGPSPSPWAFDKTGVLVQDHLFTDAAGNGILITIREVGDEREVIVPDGLVERTRTTTTDGFFVTIYFKK